MVQIQLPEQEKVQVQGLKVVPSRGKVPLLPHTVREVAGTRKEQTARNRSCIFLVFLSILFAIVSVKKICDLKEENLRLLQQLALERQKDSVLKLAVRDNISPSRFLGHQFTDAEVAEVTEPSQPETQPASWSINLLVLWSSPEVSVCDMRRLSNILAQEIYSKGAEEQEETRSPWMDLAENTNEDTEPESEETEDSAESVESVESEESEESDEVFDEPTISDKDVEDVLLKVIKEMDSDYVDDAWLDKEVEGTSEDTNWLTDAAEDYLEDNYDYLQDMDGAYDTIELFRDYSEDGEAYDEWYN